MTLENFINKVKPFSMTSVERITALFNSLEHIRVNNIKGDIVECGVWKGGNILGIIEYLNHYEMFDRNVWLYDTFNGMTDPDDNDVTFDEKKAIDILESVMCKSSLDEVKNVLSVSKFPNKNINYVIGDVLETLNDENNIPKEISILRLDTDWYQSTKKELQILYPNLKNDGVLIVDDYGHWQGAKKAVDEYFDENVLFDKIDYTGIKLIK